MAGITAERHALDHLPDEARIEGFLREDELADGDARLDMNASGRLGECLGAGLGRSVSQDRCMDDRWLEAGDADVGQHVRHMGSDHSDLGLGFGDSNDRGVGDLEMTEDHLARGNRCKQLS